MVGSPLTGACYHPGVLVSCISAFRTYVNPTCSTPGGYAGTEENTYAEQACLET